MNVWLHPQLGLTGRWPSVRFSPIWRILENLTKIELDQKIRHLIFTEGNSNEIDHSQNSGKSWRFRTKLKKVGIEYLPKEIPTKSIIFKILASPDHSEQNWKKSASNIYRRKYQRNWSFSKFWQVQTISNKTEKSRRRIFTEGNTNEIDHLQNSGKSWPFRTKLEKVGVEYLPREIPTKSIIFKILASTDHFERNWKSRQQKFTEGNTNEIDHFQNSGKFWPFRAKRIWKWKTITDSISEHPYSVKHVDRWIRFGHKNDSKMWWIRFGHMSYSSNEIP
jgi:hypothetical protein